MAASLGDSACAYAWGGKLAKWAGDPAVPASVLHGDDRALTPDEQALAAWARKVVGDPNGTGPDDVEDLRTAGFSDDQIFAATLLLVLRLAFSSFNDALGLHSTRPSSTRSRPPSEMLSPGVGPRSSASHYAAPDDCHAGVRHAKPFSQPVGYPELLLGRGRRDGGTVSEQAPGNRSASPSASRTWPYTSNGSKTCPRAQTDKARGPPARSSARRAGR